MKASLMLVRILGLALIVLGICFWFGVARGLISLHMLLGLLLVIALWVVSGFGIRAHVNLGLIIGAIIWGFIVLAFGMVQTTIMPGSQHWIIQVLHLIVGLIAMGLAESIARRARNRAATSASAAATA